LNKKLKIICVRELATNITSNKQKQYNCKIAQLKNSSCNSLQTNIYKTIINQTGSVV